MREREHRSRQILNRRSKVAGEENAAQARKKKQDSSAATDVAEMDAEQEISPEKAVTAAASADNGPGSNAPPPPDTGDDDSQPENGGETAGPEETTESGPAEKTPAAQEQPAEQAAAGGEKQDTGKSAETPAPGPTAETKTEPAAKTETSSVSSILYEKVPTERWNSTGYKFSSSTGKVLSSGEVYNFIREQKRSGNEEFKAAFKVHVKGKNPEGTYPTFEIAGSKIKYFGYSFDPDFGKKEDPKKEGDTFLGESKSTAAIVRLKDKQGQDFKGIRLHATPSPNDKDYVNRLGASAIVYGPESRLTIVNAANDKNPGWVYVRMADGAKGWIEESWLTPIDKGYGVLYHLRQVSGGEGVDDLLREIKGLQRDIGYDNRAFAYVLWHMNKGNAGVYINTKKFDDSLRDHSIKNAFDPYYAGLRAVYESVEIKSGAVLRVPTKKGIDEMIAAGQVPTRPELMNAAIKGGRIVVGLLIGIPTGIAMAAADMVTGLWDMVKSIFTGEILDQLEELYNAISNMTWEDVKVFLLSMVGIDLKKFDELWNGGNVKVQTRYEYIGEIIGRLLFEVILTIVTGGAKVAQLLGKLPGMTKVLKVVEKVKGTMKGVTSKLTPDALRKMKKAEGVTDHAADIKKTEKAVDGAGDASKVNKAERIEDVADKKTQSAKDHERKVNDDTKDRMNKEADKEVEKGPDHNSKAAALAMAKIITEGADEANIALPALMAELSFLKAMKGVKGFDYKKTTTGHYRIIMLGSEYTVDGDYTPGNDKGNSNNSTSLTRQQKDILNKIKAKLALYPKVIDLRTGKHISLPHVDRIVPKNARVNWGSNERGQFIKQWYDKGYPTPKGGWGKYDIHHITPKEFGGSNDFWNLVPVETKVHQQTFNAFWREFGNL